jgi:hypothetical protein
MILPQGRTKNPLALPMRTVIAALLLAAAPAALAQVRALHLRTLADATARPRCASGVVHTQQRRLRRPAGHPALVFERACCVAGPSGPPPRSAMPLLLY